MELLTSLDCEESLFGEFTVRLLAAAARGLSWLRGAVRARHRAEQGFVTQSRPVLVEVADD